MEELCTKFSNNVVQHNISHDQKQNLGRFYVPYNIVLSPSRDSDLKRLQYLLHCTRDFLQGWEKDEETERLRLKDWRMIGLP